MPVAGRKPLSTTTKEANGTFEKNPKRRNVKEPKLTPARPKAPRGLGKSKIWKQVCDHLESMGVLTNADEMVIESIARNEISLVAASRELEKGLVVDGKLNPANAAWQKAMDRRLRLLTELGLTPSSRTRLEVIVDKTEEDPVGDFLRNLGARNT